MIDEQDRLIAEQQLKIRKLEQVMGNYKQQLTVGGPLNDRFYFYNKKVEDSFIPDGYYLAKPLAEIDKVIHIYDSIEDCGTEISKDRE